MKRSPWRWACVLSCALFATALAETQDYPTRPIRLILGAPAGGSADSAARIIANKLREVVGQPVVIENRPGGSGVRAAETVARSAPDGYTLEMHAFDLSFITSVLPDVDFDPDKELMPVAMLTGIPQVIVAARHARFANIIEFTQLAKSSPQPLSYGSVANSPLNRLVAQWIAFEAKTKLLFVPYPSGPEAALGAAAGDVDIAITSAASVYPGFIQAGKIKVIALTGPEHPSFLPRAWPTLEEGGLPIEVTNFDGLFGPLNIAPSTISFIDNAADMALRDDSVRAKLGQIGFAPQYAAQGQFADRLRKYRLKYEKVLRDLGMATQQ
jgi:tripartite-type tricarboxylate transporter receptor subunit TctC